DRPPCRAGRSEAQAEAGAREQRRADRDDALARPAGRVGLIEQVLDAGEDLDVLADRPRQHEVHHDVVPERQRVEVVLVLIAHEACGERGVEPPGVLEADTHRGAVLRDLREALALQARLLRGLDDARVGEEIAGDEAPLLAEPELELGLDAADAREVEVLALAAGGAGRATVISSTAGRSPRTSLGSRRGPASRAAPCWKWIGAGASSGS